MKYIRTKDGIELTGNKVYFLHPIEIEMLKEEYDVKKIIKDADTIEELVTTGDLLIVEDTTRTSRSTFPIIYNEKVPFAYKSPIYKIREFYIKSNGNFIKVAEIKGKGELELL